VIPKARRHGLRLLVTPDTILHWHRNIGLRHQVFRQLPVAHADQNNPQAVIPGGRIEAGEFLRFWSMSRMRMTRLIPYIGRDQSVLATMMRLGLIPARRYVRGGS
jgi:hypothetical protein